MNKVRFVENWLSVSVSVYLNFTQLLLLLLLLLNNKAARIYYNLLEMMMMMIIKMNSSMTASHFIYIHFLNDGLNYGVLILFLRSLSIINLKLLYDFDIYSREKKKSLIPN